MLIMSVFAAFSKAHKGVYVGPCPHCEHEIVVNKDLVGFNCPVCQTRVIREEDKFVVLGG